jgi:hypothetical protein
MPHPWKRAVPFYCNAKLGRPQLLEVQRYAPDGANSDIFYGNIKI